MITNGQFETAGAAPGLAASWTATFVSSEEEWADWEQNPGDGFSRAQEGFEAGWTGVSAQTFQGAFQGAPTDQTAAVFNSGLVATPFDSFEREWPAPFHTGLIATVTPSEVATFTGGLDQERFDTGWVQGWWVETGSGPINYTMPATSPAVFEAGNFDSFDWHDFDDDIEDFGGVTALFNGLDNEGFEAFQAPELVSMNNVTDRFTFVTTSLDPIVIDEVLYVTAVGGTLPSPLEEDVRYYSTELSGGGQSFMLKPSLSGVAISITDDGSGEQYVLRDPAQWWTRKLSV